MGLPGARRGTSRRHAPAPGADPDGPERGPDAGVSSMEWALLTPLIILVLLFVVQFAMVYHARQVALAAAQAGARVARTQPVGAGWQDQAVAKATGDVRAIGPNLLSGLEVGTGEADDERWVTVSGEAVRVIPFMTFHVRQRSQGPIECFRPDVDEGTACQGAG